MLADIILRWTSISPVMNVKEARVIKVMKAIISIGVLFLCTGFKSQAITPYLIQKIQLKDERLISLLGDYIAENHLQDVEGAILLKYDKEDSVDNFYVGYMVRNHLQANPPSYYTIVKDKLVLIYSGLEHHLSFNQNSFKMVSKDCKRCFAEGIVVVEPTYWHVVISGQSIEKRVVKENPFRISN